MDCAEGLVWLGHQAHHIIPNGVRNHRVLRRIGIALDDATNGVFLRNATHLGPHDTYHRAVWAALDQVPATLSLQSTMEMVYEIQYKATGKLLELNESGLRVSSLTEQEWLRVLL